MDREMMKIPRLTAMEDAALVALHAAGASEDYAVPFRSVAKAGFPETHSVRRHVRALARKQCAEYRRGLCTEDGDLAGSGYGLTRLGIIALRARAQTLPQPDAAPEGGEVGT